MQRNLKNVIEFWKNSSLPTPTEMCGKNPLGISGNRDAARMVKILPE